VFTNGSMQTTSQPFDVAISGNGFLQVRRPNGQPAYTRAGQLQPDQNGVLVNAQGLPLVPQITVPNNATAGHHRRKRHGQRHHPGPGRADRTGPADADHLRQSGRPAGPGREPVPGNRRQRHPNEGRPGDAAFGKLKQGALEGSNVQVVEEMVDMIAAQRTYEMNTKVLSAADNMLQYLAQAAR
jgi:flagellar basal-body rod protein FlgG